MTEDDTFEALKRASFQEVRRLWVQYRSYGNGAPEEKLIALGWTRAEYIEEHYRRWRNNEL